MDLLTWLSMFLLACWCLHELINGKQAKTIKLMEKEYQMALADLKAAIDEGREENRSLRLECCELKNKFEREKSRLEREIQQEKKKNQKVLQAAAVNQVTMNMLFKNKDELEREVSTHDEYIAETLRYMLGRMENSLSWRCFPCDIWNDGNRHQCSQCNGEKVHSVSHSYHDFMEQDPEYWQTSDRYAQLYPFVVNRKRLKLEHYKELYTINESEVSPDDGEREERERDLYQECEK